MRPSLFFGLVALCVVAAAVRIPASAASHSDVGSGSAQSASAQPVFTKTVEGFGVTDEDARERALETARDRVTDFLAEQGETNYKPTTQKLLELRIVPPLKDIEVTEKKFE